jgi:hypothetical protein
LSEKSTTFWRSGVIETEAITMSSFFACRPGIMPSKSCCTSVHCAFISAQSALAMSMSKPTILPSAPTELNGG